MKRRSDCQLKQSQDVRSGTGRTRNVEEDDQVGEDIEKTKYGNC